MGVESRESGREQEKTSFNASVIDLLPSSSDRVKFVAKFNRANLGGEKEIIKERMIKIFGREISPEELDEFFSFPEEGIESQTLIGRTNKYEDGIKTPGIETASIAFNREKGAYAGQFQLFFHRTGDKPSLYVVLRNLEAQRTGKGLDIECRLEKFCRNNGIWEIRNTAATWPMRGSSQFSLGAYVWARYGYEFDRSEEVGPLIGELEKYLNHNKIDPVIELSEIKRPIDIATLKGRDSRGKLRDIGKQFLISCVVDWHGRRDLRPDSQGTSDFIRYLRERGRDNLVEKYYNDVRIEGE